MAVCTSYLCASCALPLSLLQVGNDETATGESFEKGGDQLIQAKVR